MRIASYKRTKEIIEKHDFLFKKNFGQNFLIDEHVLNKIMASSEIGKDDVVIEIGPGIGSLTEEILIYAYKVYAIEIDSNLIPILNENLSAFDNFEIINQDVLKTDLNEIIERHPDKNIKVVANLPYYITTPIIMNLLESRLRLKSLTVMIQKEVAERMKAKAGTKDYGALTLAVNYYGSPYLAANVPRNCFMPRPNVDSAVIRINIYDEPPVSVKDEKLLFNLIRLSFNQRRKTLVNSIFNQSDFQLTKDELGEIICRVGFDKDIRGEKLSLADFAKLSDSFSDKLV